MDEKLITQKFESMGARVKIRFPQSMSRDERFFIRSAPESRLFRIDIRRDNKGDYFDLLTDPGIALDVIDHRADERHLLLMARDGALKDKFLCGHDERHWFVAAIPEKPGVSNVRTAMEALKPALVIEAQTKQKLKHKARSAKEQGLSPPGRMVFHSGAEDGKRNRSQGNPLQREIVSWRR